MLMTKLNPLFISSLRLIWGLIDWGSGSGTYINIYRHTENRERGIHGICIYVLPVKFADERVTEDVEKRTRNCKRSLYVQIYGQ